MKAKRAIALVLLCVCAVWIATPLVSAEEPADSMDVVSKVYTLSINEVQGFIQASPATPAYWEYPMLEAGEDYVEGTLVLRNDSEIAASMALKSVTLPYGDEAKLAYLDHLMLTVKEGDTVLFDNTLAHINDPQGGLSIVLDNMAPQEEHVYTIKMRCLYSYSGDPVADASMLTWNFEAQTQAAQDEEAAGGMGEWVQITLIVAGVTAVLIVAVFLVRAIFIRRLRGDEPDTSELDDIMNNE